MGPVMVWARIAALAPRLVNALTHAPGLGPVAKAVAGIAPAREIPRFAPYTFRRWFRTRPRRNPGGKPVLLYPDTFNDHFHPETAIAATEVLEANGWRVEIPRSRICCGRPLYDWGMLDLAERMLRRNLRVLAPALDRGTPVAVLEPSCAAVFRDEMVDLLGRSDATTGLRDAVKLLPELVEAEGDRFRVGTLGRPAVVQPHCHQHAVLGLEAEKGDAAASPEA